MGKKSPAPPPAPDYTGAAIQQGQANLEAARLTARLSNPNVSTPLGGQRVTFGRDVFNQSAYDKAMADYNKQLEAYNAAKAGGQPYTPPGGQPPQGLPTGLPTGVGGDMVDRDVFRGPRGEPGELLDYGGGAYQMGAGGGLTFDPTTGAPVAPTREQFTSRTDLDTPFIEQYLTPEAQATLEAQQRVERALSGLGEQAIGRVSDIYGTNFRPQGLPEQQFRFDYGQLPTAPDLAGMGQFQRGFRAEEMPYAPDITAMGRAGGGPAAPGEIAGANLGGLQNVAYGPEEGQYGFARGFVPTERLQQGVDVGGLAQMPVSAGMTGQQAILSRLTPQLQRERAGLENQLRNQGLVPGGEAYNREIELFNQRANDLLQQSALQGIGLDAQMRAQGFSERQIQAEMANQARQAQFGMGVQQAGLYNQALQQNLAQGMGIAEARNRAQAQDFQQRLAAGQFGREGQQLAFQMGQSAQQAQNQALAQNQAAAMQQYQAQLGRQAQGFGQQLDLAGLYNASLAAQQQSALQQAQAAAALQAQGYNQAQGAASFQNAQRQAALQEQLALRSQPLNEIAAIMGGAQVQMPQFQAYQGADVAAAPIFGATQAAGNFAQQNYANQVAAQNAQMGLYGSLAGMAGSALGGQFGGALGQRLFQRPPPG
jgi:hypothetical protein